VSPARRPRPPAQPCQRLAHPLHERLVAADFQCRLAGGEGEEPDARDFRLSPDDRRLSNRHEPARHRGEEHAPVYHVSTLSACPRSDGGRVTPKADAVLPLITREWRVGCSNGRSPGLAALRRRCHSFAALRPRDYLKGVVNFCLTRNAEPA